MNHTKQRIVIAALIAIGVLGTGAVLWRGHGEEDGHDHGHEEKAEAHHEDEGPRRVALTADQQKAAGITVAPVAAGTMQAAREFAGEIRVDEERMAHVVARVAGVAERVPVVLGQQLRAGEVLAVLASPALAELRSELLTAQRRQEAARANHDREKQLWQERIAAEQDYSLALTALREADIAVDAARQKLAAIGAVGGSGNRFELRAPLAGTVVEKHLARGEAVKEDASLFTVADLGRVSAEFAVAAQDLGLVRAGQKVQVSSSAQTASAEGVISYVSAVLGEQSRTAKARVSLPNREGLWRPGLFVTVRVLGDAQPLALALPAEAVQTVDGRPTVFAAVDGAAFEPRAVKTGRSDGRIVELLDGVKAGERVAVGNAHVIKAELGKAAAEHTH